MQCRVVHANDHQLHFETTEVITTKFVQRVKLKYLEADRRKRIISVVETGQLEPCQTQ